MALPQGWEVAPIDPGKGWLFVGCWLKKTRTLPLKSFTGSSFSMFFLDVCFFGDEHHSYCNIVILIYFFMRSYEGSAKKLGFPDGNLFEESTL